MFRARVATRITKLGLASGSSFSPATSAGMATSAGIPKIVAPSEAEAEAVKTELGRLLEAPESGKWSLTAAGDGIERSFKFKTFTKTWDFMTAVSLQCKLKNHHPEWSNVYSTTFIRWTTHSPTPGLTRKDTELAALCDALARDFGELPISDQGAASAGAAACGLQGLANQAGAVAGGDCCKPSKREK